MPLLAAIDSFDRSNRSLNGDAMSDGVNTWEDGAGTAGHSISGNQVVNDASYAVSTVVDFSVVNQSAQLKWVSGYGGPAARVYYTGSQWRYYVLKAAVDMTPDVVKLLVYKNSGITTLATGTTTLVSGDVLKIECIGTTIRGYVNGVLEVSVTNADIASGKPGIAQASGNGVFDDFEAAELETLVAAHPSHAHGFHTGYHLNGCRR